MISSFYVFHKGNFNKNTLKKRCIFLNVLKKKLTKRIKVKNKHFAVDIKKKRSYLSCVK